MPYHGTQDIYPGKKEKAVKMVASGPVLQVRKVISLPFVPLAVARTTCSQHCRTQSYGCAPCCQPVTHAGSLGSPRASTASTSLYLPQL